MVASFLSKDEAGRLASLYHYNILHSPPEGIFDQIVALSARLFGLPIAYVLLLNAEQGHYKATHGFALPQPQPRQDLLCAQVIRQDNVVVYHDLATAPQALDARAIASSLAQQARFYAGAPLRMPNQHSIGTLCLVDQQPRSFSPHEQEVLEELAGVVSQAIAVRHQLLQTPELGETQWQDVCTETHDEVHQLAMLVRYLLARYPEIVPVPKEVLQLVSRRLQEVHELLTDRIQAPDSASI